MRPLSILALAASLIAAPAHAAEKFFTFGQWGNIGLEIPDGWKADVRGKDTPSGSAIRLIPRSGVPVVLLVTPFPAIGGDEEMDRVIQQSLEDVRRRMLAVAVEADIPIKDLAGPNVRAKYASITDRTVEQPTLEDFKYADQGLAAIGRFYAGFTVFSNVPDAPERAQALEIVKSARHLLAGPPWRTPEGGIALAYPGKTWRLALELPGFLMGSPELGNAGEGVKLMGLNPMAEAMITVFIEKAEPGRTAAGYREWAWERRAPMERHDVVRSERGEMALLEFSAAEYEGERVDQRSLNVYLVRDGVWIDVHLSKVDYKPQDKKLFDDVLASIRFVD